MVRQPKINPAAIDLLARHFNSHRKGIPELLKNAREIYLRRKVPAEKRIIALHYYESAKAEDAYFECIDFAGVSGDAIDEDYVEWANPDAAPRGLKPGEAEGGQGNGGKAYIRQMFQKAFFASVFDGKLSVVSFHDAKKHQLDFYPDDARGKDQVGDNPAFPVRADAARWLAAYDLAPESNITIVRGIGPLKPIERDRLLEEIQQFAQARQTIETCKVHFYLNGKFKRELKVTRPALHPMFPEPIIVPVPLTLELNGDDVATARPPQYPAGELELCIASRPLMGQALSTWNRIDFLGDGVGVIGYKDSRQLPSAFSQYLPHVFGRCRVPLLKDPKDNYEMQGRGPLNEGELSSALYAFIAAEADKLLAKIAKQAANAVNTKKQKDLDKLNKRLAKWIETKITSLRGMEDGEGGGGKKKREKKDHLPPTTLKIHRPTVDICAGVKYQLRAVASDADGRPVPPGKLVWKSQNPSVASVHAERGVIEAHAPGMATVTATNDTGLTTPPIIINVHRAEEIILRTPSPAHVGSNRRLPLAIAVKTAAGRTIKDAVVSWKTSDEEVAKVTADGVLIGGELGEAEVTAFVGNLETAPLEVVVEKGAAGKPKGGGTGAPLVLLSGQNECPFERTAVILGPTHPLVFQRPNKPDYENNVFWINLQHPLSDALLKGGVESLQWRAFHFQRLVDVFTIIEMRDKFRDGQEYDVDQILEEIQETTRELYASAKEEMFDLLFDADVDLAKLQVA